MEAANPLKVVSKGKEARGCFLEVGALFAWLELEPPPPKKKKKHILCLASGKQRGPQKSKKGKQGEPILGKFGEGTPKGNYKLRWSHPRTHGSLATALVHVPVPRFCYVYIHIIYARVCRQSAGMWNGQIV